MYRVHILFHKTSNPSTFHWVQDLLSSSSLLNEDDNDNGDKESSHNLLAMGVMVGDKLREAVQARRALGLPL